MRAGATRAATTRASGRSSRRRAGTGARGRRRCTPTAGTTRVEVLRDPPGVRGGEVAHDPAGDPGGLLTQRRVAEHVRGRQQCLDGVHVGVDAAVPVERRPGLVPLLDEHPVGVVPEAGEQHLEGLLEQLAAAGSIGRRGTGGREDDEGMLVGRLGGRDRTVGETGRTSLRASRPGTSPQRGHAVVGECGAARPPQQVAERVDVRHPAGDPELHRPVELGHAVLVEPGEAALRVA